MADELHGVAYMDMLLAGIKLIDEDVVIVLERAAFEEVKASAHL